VPGSSLSGRICLRCTLVLLCYAFFQGAQDSGGGSSSLSDEDQLNVINCVRRTAGVAALTQMVQMKCLAEAGQFRSAG
jgi:hypothetical protein